MSISKASVIKGILGLSILVLIANYQNCSGSGSSEEKETGAPTGTANDCVANPAGNGCQAPAPAACQFNGTDLLSGTTVTAFQNSAVAFGAQCVSEVRNCSDGALDGSFAFASCTVGAPSACLFDSQTIAHGAQVTSYQNSTVPHGSSCVSESRSCDDGALSGSYSFSSCTVGAPASCLFNGQTIAHGDSAVAFSTSTVAHGSTCQSESRTCDNGALSGSYDFGSCNVDAPQSCLFDGQTIAHGQGVAAFEASSVSFGGTCNQEVRSCDNGTLSGGFAFASCNVAAPQSCLFNGQTIAHGENVEAYLKETAAFGTTCQQQTRTCTDGTLSGDHTFGSCTVDAALNCEFNGQPVLHGSFVMAYKEATPSKGACQDQKRTCTNGVLSGAFKFSQCQ